MDLAPPSPLNFSRVKVTPKIKLWQKAGGQREGELPHFPSLLTIRGGGEMQPLDDFNGVTYVNEVIAINSLLCGSLGAWLRAIRGGLSLDFRAIANGVGAARAGGLQVWDARGWVGGGMGGGFGVLVGFFFFSFLPERRRRKEGEGGRGEEGKLKK